MFSGIDSFPLMAVPFFILAAELMSGGALTTVLLRFAAQFVGHLRGGLGYANVLSLTLFSGISGSALADAAGPGSMGVKMMEKAGYSRAYAASLTASTAVVGPIIPPSIAMIIYAMQDGQVSVGGLFMAGFLPGALIALGTKQVWMAPVSAIGAAAPVMGTGGEIPETLAAKVVSYYSGYFRSAAESNGHNPEIAEAFINKEKEVKVGNKVINEKSQKLKRQVIGFYEGLAAKSLEYT
jgi:tripartite ATP-independent transporter DctM subunit